MSALDRKADIGDGNLNVRLMTRSGPSASHTIATKTRLSRLSQTFGQPSVKPPRLAPTWHLNGFLPTR